MQRAETPPVHRFYRPDQSVRPGQQVRSIHTPTQNTMPPPPPKLLRMITSLHEEMKGTVQYDGSSSDPFPIKSGVKRGSVLAPTLFGILFSLLLSYALRESEEGIYLHTRSDGSLFNLARLRAKTKVRKVLVREMLFADDAAIPAHTETALQELINCFAHACSQFSLTISIKKTNILGQDVSAAPSISIGHCTLGHRAEHEDRQGFSSIDPPDQGSVGEHHAHHQDQDPSVSSVRAEHTVVR